MAPRLSQLIILTLLPLSLGGCGNTANTVTSFDFDRDGNATGVPSGGVLPSAGLANTYETNAIAIIQNNCTSCHLATWGPAGIYGLTDPNHLVLYHLVVEGQPTQSPLYTSIANGSMPPGAPLSAADQQTISQWITAAGTPTSP